ncbi:MAG: hypothetical protein JOZ52_14335, partial [Acidobacteria bacterium]|nr:hypothetical protein [Acidobacteriota bacterium]
MLRRLLSIMLAQLLLVSVCAGGLGSERQKSDSEAKGLKGQPQKVTYEWATLTKTGEAVTEAERKISSIETYDPQGNLTQVESYFQGSIHSRTHYFNLDGARASKFEILSQINGGGGIG